MRKTPLLLLPALGLVAWVMVGGARSDSARLKKKTTQGVHVETDRDWEKRPDHWWKERLKPEQYEVLRKAGTERAFTGKLWDQHDPGVYLCAGCGQTLFTSTAKFDSGTGWPSFTIPETPGAVKTHEDRSYGTVRVEVLCSRCGGHLGHVFQDGPAPSGTRYCMNSVSLDFKPKK